MTKWLHVWGKYRSKTFFKLRGYFTKKKALKVFFYRTMSVNMLQRHPKCHGMCNVKMCKYRQDMNCDPHVDETVGGGPERPPLEMPCVSEWIYCQPWIAWLLFLSTQLHWFEDPLKVMRRQSDQLSLFKVRVFIKIDRLTGRYFEATALTFMKRQHSTCSLGPFPAK